MDKKDQSENVYELWYEFLKKSDDYEFFCDHVRGDSMKRTNIHLVTRQKDGLTRPDGKVITPKQYNHFINIYTYWGDVHNISFETLWKSFPSEKAVQELSEIKSTAVFNNLYASKYYRSYGRYPGLADYAALESSHFIYVKIDLWAKVSSQEIAEQIGMIRSRRRKECAERISDISELNRYIRPTGKVSLDVLKKYFRILVLKDKQKLKWVKITEIVPDDPKKVEDENYDPVNYRRLLQQQLSNARKIVKNVEEGLFPGSY